MKFADGRVEDREMRIIPKQSEIKITRTALVHHPKWVVNFKAKEVIYTRKILAASNTKLMDELEYCPKHFSRWRVWQEKKSTYTICDTCGAAYCEDHINLKLVCLVSRCVVVLVVAVLRFKMNGVSFNENP